MSPAVWNADGFLLRSRWCRKLEVVYDSAVFSWIISFLQVFRAIFKASANKIVIFYLQLSIPYFVSFSQSMAFWSFGGLRAF